MKTLKLTLAIIVIVFFTCGNTLGQVWHVDVVVTFDEYDMTPWCPECPKIGIITGTYTYSYTIKLSEAGKIESIHWVAKDCTLKNQNGDKVIVVDTGHDNLGVLWDFWNNPNEGNGYDPKLQYDVKDGWLNEYIPDSMPIEGTMVNMSYKTMVKGQKYDVYAGMVQLHRNAKGVITADVVNP